MSNAKKWFKEFSEAFKGLILLKTGRSRKDEEFATTYPLTTNLAAYAAVTVLLGSSFGGSFFTLGPQVASILQRIGTEISEASNSTDQTATAGVSILTKERNQQAYKVTELEYCIEGNKKWDLWLGTMSRDVKDDEHFFLPEGIGAALFKYQGDVNLEKKCTFSFVPRGDQAVNYVISFDEFYQIVIGDNDYWTIALRASDSLDAPLLPVKEKETNLTRPRLLSNIKKGSLVEAVLEQSFTEDKKYDVKLTLHYTPDLSYESAKRTEVFEWEFVPSPIIHLQLIDLSVGLIRGDGDRSHVGVSFLIPDPNGETTSGTIDN